MWDLIQHNGRLNTTQCGTTYNTMRDLIQYNKGLNTMVDLIKYNGGLNIIQWGT